MEHVERVDFCHHICWVVWIQIFWREREGKKLEKWKSFHILFSLLKPDPPGLPIVSHPGQCSPPPPLFHHFLCSFCSQAAASSAQPWMASATSAGPFYIWVRLCVSFCISVIKCSSWPSGSFPKWSIGNLYSEKLVFQQSINNVTY